MLSRTLSKVVLALMVGALVFPALSSSAGSPTFRLVIPRIGLNTTANYVSQDYGPFVYYQDYNTIMIAGHRVTHSHPFYWIDLIRNGDPIYTYYNGHKTKWIVKRHAIYTPDQAKHLRWYPGMVLSACTPRHFATYRYVVFARPA